MLENIHWLGHDSFRLDGGVTLYIDPCKLPAGQPQAGVILVTHEHFDHLSPDDIDQIAGPGTVVVGPASVTGQIRGPGDGHRRRRRQRGRSAAWRCWPSPPTTWTSSARPASRTTHGRPGTSGYVVTLDGVRYYHAGDTDAVPEMADVHCDVALLPVGGTFTMTWRGGGRRLRRHRRGRRRPHALRRGHRRRA